MTSLSQQQQKVFLTEISHEIATTLQDFPSQQGTREKLLWLSEQLRSSLETPSDAIQRIGWTEPARFACTQIAIDLNIFGILAQSASAVTLAEIVQQTGKDVTLLSRVLKHLAATNMISESAANQYKATSLSTALVEPKYRDGITYLRNVAGPSFHGIPDYLKQTDYQHPTNIADGPFQFAHKTQKPFFIFLAENPELAQQFNNYMSGYRQGKKSWCDADFYPLETHLSVDSASTLLVDVGGGLGHDLEELRSEYPALPGTLVLQDLPDVIKQVGSDQKTFELMAHDFFTSQPVQGRHPSQLDKKTAKMMQIGARAYYLHSVLHDWDDASCLKILKNLVPALKPGFSKILINEYVVPDQGAASSITSMDWLMLALGAVKERTEAQWRELLAQAGLKITRIYTYEQGTESLIEAELDNTLANGAKETTKADGRPATSTNASVPANQLYHHFIKAYFRHTINMEALTTLSRLSLCPLSFASSSAACRVFQYPSRTQDNTQFTLIVFPEQPSHPQNPTQQISQPPPSTMKNILIALLTGTSLITASQAYVAELYTKKGCTGAVAKRNVYDNTCAYTGGFQSFKLTTKGGEGQRLNAYSRNACAGPVTYDACAGGDDSMPLNVCHQATDADGGSNALSSYYSFGETDCLS
ncbi:uncharacterized protein KY384_002316 [Bacidia gigantensis]|uniref:uncharacterized protein n=1 Tax=Bacidia gigantensis TaxID=2732470 RepID=UPI001D03FA51|nr:uncharacterized protein KY384_002316 [Bacidia gigantensis]KAG8532439.1 hypothetical protein KY384_002316 [Bacidia gigantensis]